MTQSKEMTQIRDALVYARDEAERADERIKYKQALNALDRIITPPQSPNRAVLDALKSIIFDIECLEPIKKMHLEDAYKAISDAEKECVDYETEIREFISEQFKEDGTPYITEEKNCILLGMPVDANTADWFAKLRAFEHLKRQKGL